MMHIGFGLCMRLDEFIYIGVSAPLCLLPSFFWDSLLFPFLLRFSSTSSSSRRQHSNNSNNINRIKIVYTSSVPHLELDAKIASTFLLLPHTYKVYDASSYENNKKNNSNNHTQQSDSQQQQQHHSESIVWMIVDVNGSKQYGYNAFISLCQASPVLCWIPTRVLRVGFVKNTLLFFYDLFLNLYYRLYSPSWSSYSSSEQSRKRLFSTSKKTKKRGTRGGSGGGGLLESPLLDDRMPIRKLFVNAVVISSIVFLVAWNLSYIEVTKMSDYPDVIEHIGYLYQLDQGWSMFAPHPPHSEFYYTIVATLDAGEQIELWRNGGIFEWVGNKQIDYEPPEPYHVPFYNHRWFKFYEAYNRAAEKVDVHPLRLAFGRYICREWNARHSGNDTLYTFDIFYMWHDRYENNTFSSPQQELIWGHICYEKNTNTSNNSTASEPTTHDGIEEREEDEEGERDEEEEQQHEGEQDENEMGYEGYEELLEEVKEGEEQLTEEEESDTEGGDEERPEEEQENQGLRIEDLDFDAPLRDELLQQ
eukprot:TRINITY_DN5904_c0_g2_i1.p1 TRINITY_DN5904_c0_g2~~TRINITY_DN5904_c0_g2_i1.p1  ORF type:complete len:532 (+),score=193.56 TRINITY_DN5904_c0_g2_i1:1-1596(+)